MLTCFFELYSAHSGAEVLGRIGVQNPKMIERAADDSQLQAIAQDIVELHSGSGLSKVFLTGRARSIQKIRSVLRDAGIPNSTLKIRVYWADGKTGLD